jgi:hypothetical protein
VAAFDNEEESLMAPLWSRTFIVLMAGALAACSERSLSREELVQKGDRACREGYARFDEIQSKPLTNLGEAHAQTEAIIESTELEMKSLRTLHPPAEVRATWERYVALREDSLQALREGAKASRAEDTRTYALAQGRVATAGPERSRLAREIGFTVCSQPVPPK